MTTVNPILATFSPYDMLWIFLIALLLFGSKKLPELARGMGQAVREFTKAKDEVERELNRPPEQKPYEPQTQQPAQLQEHKPAESAPIASAPPTATPANAPTEPQHHA